MSVFQTYAEADACFRVRSGQAGGSIVPAEGISFLDEYRSPALGINSLPWEGQLLYLPRRLSDYRKRSWKMEDVGSYSMQMMRITMQ